MEFTKHNIANKPAVEIVSKDILIQSEQDALDLLVNVEYEHNSKIIIIHEHNLAANFFDLKTKIAGNILQKFVNYQFQLAIVGDFSKYDSKSLQDFIRESNQSKFIIFVDSVDSALTQFNKD